MWKFKQCRHGWCDWSSQIVADLPKPWQLSFARRCMGLLLGQKGRFAPLSYLHQSWSADFWRLLLKSVSTVIKFPDINFTVCKLFLHWRLIVHRKMHFCILIVKGCKQLERIILIRFSLFTVLSWREKVTEKSIVWPLLQAIQQNHLLPYFPSALSAGWDSALGFPMQLHICNCPWNHCL